jgi:membrane associated rhomboid family serine protease
MTLFFIAITALISILAFNNEELFDKMKFNAYIMVRRKEWFRLFSHGLVHANWNHLIFNMISLYFFGDLVEKSFRAIFDAKGPVLYVLMYILALAIASIPSILKHKDDHWYSSVGASGAVSAVIFSSILFDPFIGIYIFFIPIPIPGIIFGPLYLAYSQYMNKKGLDNIGHDAHFWGAVFGFFFPILFNYKLIFYFFSQLFG